MESAAYYSYYHSVTIPAQAILAHTMLAQSVLAQGAGASSNVSLPNRSASWSLFGFLLSACLRRGRKVLGLEIRLVQQTQREALATMVVIRL